MNKFVYIFLCMCSSLTSASSPSTTDTAKSANNKASILVVDTKWPVSANRLLLKPDSPMPVATHIFDASGLKCSLKNEIIGTVPLKLKNGKKRAPLNLDIQESGKISLLFMQTFNAATDGIFHQAYAMPQKTCYRILTINAEPKAIYNIEMLFNGKNCSLTLSNSANEQAPVSYKEFKEGICQNGRIQYY